MEKQTQIFIYNENGLIDSDSIKHFSLDFAKKSMFYFDIIWKSDIDPTSTVFSKLVDEDLEFVIYDYGYVLKIEGSLIKTILFIRDLDTYLDKDILFYISPSQIIENKDELQFSRSSKLIDISIFLDKIFFTKEYSSITMNL